MYLSIITLASLMASLCSDIVEHSAMSPPYSRTSYAISQLRFDETGQHTYFDLLPELGQSSQTTTWHVCVQTRDYALGALVEKDGFLIERPLVLDTAVPLVCLSGTSCDLLHGAVYSHECVAPFVEFESRLERDADISIKIFGSDGATSCEKFIHWYCSTMLLANTYAV